MPLTRTRVIVTSMTEDGSIRVSPQDVFRKYREQTEAELARLRYALAQAETAVDTVVVERDELRRQLSAGAGLPSLASQFAGPAGPDDSDLTREFPRS